jgi:hypothetical protein
MYHAPICTCAHASLSTTVGSSKRHPTNSLRFDLYQCDCSARKHALGRTYSGRSFLEEEQQRVCMRNYSDSLFALVSSNTPNLWHRLSKPSFYLDSGASDEIQLTMNLALSRLKNDDFSSSVCFLVMTDEIDLFVSAFFLDLLFERWI